jgi:hypothetical protein
LFSEIAGANTVDDEEQDENDERGRHEKGKGNWDLKIKKDTVLSESLLPYMETSITRLN